VQIGDRIQKVCEAIATVTESGDPTRYADIVAVVLFLDESTHGDTDVVFDPVFTSAYGNGLIRLREKLRRAG
jgi:hypothetical protein